MDHVIFCKDLFESFQDNKKVVLIIIRIKRDDGFLQECEYLKSDINRLFSECKNYLINEQNDEYLEYVKDQEEYIIEEILNKLLEAGFSNLFEDIKHGRSLILLLSLIELDKLKQSRHTGDELLVIKNLALENLHRLKCLKEYYGLSIIELIFLFNK